MQNSSGTMINYGSPDRVQGARAAWCFRDAPTERSQSIFLGHVASLAIPTSFVVTSASYCEFVLSLSHARVKVFY